MPPRPYNLIQNPELLRGIQSALGMHQQAPAPTLGETVQPVIVVADIASSPTTPPREEVLCFQHNVLTGVNFDFCMGIYNPAGSNVLARVNHFEAYATAFEQDMDIGVSTTAYFDASYPGSVNVGTIWFNDLRKTIGPPVALPTVQGRFFQINAAITLPQRMLARRFLPNLGGPIGITVGFPLFEPRNVILPPGTALHFINTGPLVAGDGARIYAAWTEEKIDLSLKR